MSENNQKIPKESVKDIGNSKYLKEMKELPDYSEDVEKNVSKKKIGLTTKAAETAKKPESEVPEKPKVAPDGKDELMSQKALEINSEEEIDEEGIEGFNLEYDPKIYTTKDIILLIINAISIVLLIIFLVKIPEKSLELKALRSESERYESVLPSEIPDLTQDKEKSDKLNSLFLNHSGVVDFVKEVEGLKEEGGMVPKITFASQKAVKDKTGNYGIPVIVELEGKLEEVEPVFNKLEALPFLFRPVNIEIEPTKEDINIVDFKYGGILYVNEKLGED